MKINIDGDLLISYSKVLYDYLEKTNGQKLNPIILKQISFIEPEKSFFVVRNSKVTLNTIKYEGRRFDPHFKSRRTSTHLNHQFTHDNSYVILTNQRLCVYDEKFEFIRALSLSEIKECSITKNNLTFLGKEDRSISFVTNNMNINIQLMVLVNMLGKI